MNDLFFKIPVKSSIDLTEIILSGAWKQYYNFLVKEVSPEVIDSDDFLRDLRAKHPFRAAVTKMVPYTVYDWHIDDIRKVSINMLWDGGNYVTVFSFGNDLVKTIVPAIYEPKCYYFFNTQVSHMVMNFDKPRYMFTLEFAPDFIAQDLMEYLNDPETKRSFSCY